jgi:murein DD-endopeptidase MepM/ murein hydrolase activator NlpD
LALLAGFGVTAFGIAPLVPDASDMPTRHIVQDLPVPTDLDEQLEALAGYALRLNRSDSTRAGDTPESLLRRLGATDADAARWLRQDPLARKLLEGRSGKRITANVDVHGRLQSLVARYPLPDHDGQFQRLTLMRNAQGQWQARHEVALLEATTRLASGDIHSSLFAATDAAGLPDAVAVQLADIFATDIDFHRQLRKGDSFSLVYEALLADGEPVAWNQGAGRVLAAQFTNQGKTYQALWFGAGKDGLKNGFKGGYYDFSGESKQRAFLASPMEFSRVTSGFAMRFHPVLQRWRAHTGVDYGAPVGTPVRSVGEGIVESAGYQGGYGQAVVLRHSGGQTTLYGHLSRIDVRKGQSVDQGQRIGSVGATGLATGPHLHFEFRVNGVHRDPLQIARQAQPVPLAAAQRPLFQQTLAQWRAPLLAAENLGPVPSRFE